MTPPRATPPGTLDDLAKQFPDWSLWKSRGSRGLPGAYYASRRQPLTQAQADAGVPATLDADTIAGLAEKLTGDRHREVL